MISAEECFDEERARYEIFEVIKIDVRTTIEFVTETARLLIEKGRENDFVYIADRSIELLEGNLMLKKLMLLQIIRKCDDKAGWAKVTSYYLDVEKLLSNSVDEKSLRIEILLKIGKGYLETAHYSKSIKYTLIAENIIEDQSDKKVCCEYLGSAYLRQAEYKKAIDYYNKGLSISTEIEDLSGIATNNRNLGITYLSWGQYEKAIHYCNKGLAVSTEIGDWSGIASISANLGNAYRNLGQYKKAIDYYNKGLAISTENGDLSGIASNNGNLGNTYNNLGQYEKAIDCFSKGLAISTENGDLSGIASNIGNLGNVYNNLGHYKKAIKCYEKGLAISTEIGDRSRIASNNGNLGNAYRCLGYYDKAMEYYCKGLEIANEIGDRSGIASCMGNLGNVYHNLGQYEKAILYYNRVLALSTETGNRLGIANSVENLGSGYLCLGNYEKAIEYCMKSLAICTEIGYLSGKASNYGNLGIAYLSSGQYEKAIECFLRGLEISIEIGDRSGISSNNANLGNVYCSLRQYGKAIHCFHKSLEISVEIGDRSGVASNNGNLGNAYSNIGHYEKAIEYYCNGLAISTEIGDRSGVASNNGNLGNAYRNLGQYEKAIEYYNKGLAMCMEMGDQSGIANYNGNLGIVYSNLGQYEKGITVLKKALETSQEIGDRFCECFSLGSIGYSFFLLYQSKTCETEDLSTLQVAVSFLRRSVVCGDEIFSDLDVDENKITFTSEYFGRYVTLMHCFILMKRSEAALLVIDLGKAKALHAFLEKRGLGIVYLADYTRMTWQRIDDNKEKEQVDHIEKTLLLQKNGSTVLYYCFNDKKLNIWVLNGDDEIWHVISGQEKDNSLTEDCIFRNMAEALTSFSVNLDQVFLFIRDASISSVHEVSQLQASMSVTVTKKSHTLPHKSQSCDSIFIHNTPSNFEVNRKRLKKVIQHYDLAVDVAAVGFSAPLQTSIKSCLVTSENLSDLREVYGSSAPAFQALFQKLIQPVKKFIKGTKLIIVPDKFLFLTPFCALIEENESPMLTNYSIQITPSLHTLYSGMKRPPQASLGFALFVGNPAVGKVSFRGKEVEVDTLPNATDEAICLASFFDAKPLVGDQATKKVVLKLIQGAAIIHIAAHGDRERGEIFLAPNPNCISQDFLPKEESYLVREKDITEIRLNARLVVLCCCHTGRGKISSEGVIGLARAFLAAGARSVLAAPFLIRDENTKRFMVNFYNEINKETSVCEALRRTMNIFQQHGSPTDRHVTTWASFTIVGEDVMFTKLNIEEIKKKSRQ